MALEEKLNYVVESMHDIICNQPDISKITTIDYGWDNYRYASPIFRQAHVERYFQDGMMVVHTTCFPHANIDAPIFGFDVVAAQKSQKILGYFLDWSPVLNDNDWHDKEWLGDRILPEWATVFSKQFIALRPEKDDYDELFDYAIQSFSNYLSILKHANMIVDPDTLCKIVAKQNEYCYKQALNPRTFAALKHKIGDEEASFFMQNVLFPKLVITE